MTRFPEANKRFGQHFLNSPHVIQAITGTLPPVDAIVEVGPGPAVLTPHLINHGLPVWAVEMDKRFTKILEGVLPAGHVHMQDALTVNWPRFFQDHQIKKAWMVSNLPYNVSVPLTLAFMRFEGFHTMTLMYQKEVAEKFHPRDLKNGMSSLAALSGIFFKVSKVVDAPPGAFVPPPKVMSQVLKFERLPEPLLPLTDWPRWEEFMRVLFANRRKQMQGILRERIPLEAIQEFCRQQELPETVRAEALTLQQVVELAKLDRQHQIE
jgi:16S rRNA (adenine1518-N6/adenine1519-N6)-dimethyltransferase